MYVHIHIYTFTYKHTHTQICILPTTAAFMYLWDGDLLDKPQTIGQWADHTVEFTQT